MMPGLSGIDVLRQVRADESLGDVRIILLTALFAKISTSTTASHRAPTTT